MDREQQRQQAVIEQLKAQTESAVAVQKRTEERIQAMRFDAASKVLAARLPGWPIPTSYDEDYKYLEPYIAEATEAADQLLEHLGVIRRVKERPPTG